MGGTSTDWCGSIALDTTSNIYTTGYYQGTADFDPGTGTFNLTSDSLQDIFISKLDASGNFVYAKSMGGTSSDWSGSIALDASGNIYTTGIFGGTADFDPGVGSFNLTSEGNADIFVHKMSQTTVRLSENKLLNTIKVYPNPANDEVFIEILSKQSSINLNNQAGYSVFGIDGKKVLEGKIQSFKSRISTKNLESGLYFIEVSIGKEKFNGKLVIAK